MTLLIFLRFKSSIGSHAASSPYNHAVRNPLFVDCRNLVDTELLLLSRHYHPSVAIFAKALIQVSEQRRWLLVSQYNSSSKEPNFLNWSLSFKKCVVKTCTLLIILIRFKVLLLPILFNFTSNSTLNARKPLLF